MKSTIFGDFTIDSFGMSNLYLFLLIIPFLVYAAFFMFKSKIINSSEKTKSRINFIAAFSLLTISLILYIDDTLKTGEFFNGISELFKNLNMYLSMIVASLMIFNKHSVVKMLVPTTIILAIAPLVENPHNVLTSAVATNDVLLATVPVLSVFLTKRNVSVKGLIISLAISFIFLSAIFGSNTISVNNNLMNVSYLQNNSFYGFFQLNFLEVLIFISAFMFAQAFVWFIIKFFIFERQIHFVESISKEFISEKRQFKKLIREIKKMDLNEIEFSLFESEFISLDVSSIEDVEQPLIFENQNELIPFSIIRTRNSIGTRAPSL